MALRTKSPLGKSLGVYALLTLSALALAAQAGPLVRKVKVGDELKYRIKANVDVAGQEVSFSGVQSEKILEVGPDGTYTLESKTSDAKVVFGGQEIDLPSDQVPATTSVYNADGTIREIKGENAQADSYRAANLNSLALTAIKEAKIGEGGTYEKAADAKTGAVAYKSTYKIVGEEKIGSYDVWKIEFSTKETEGDTPAGADGTIYIDKADATMVKTVAKWTNAPFPGVPAPVSGDVTVTRE